MPAQEFLPITVKGKDYRVGPLRANLGAVLIRKIIGASGGDPNKALGILLGGMSIEDELVLQKHLLSVVTYAQLVGERTNWLPIFDGEKILAKELVTDSVSVWALQQASFNFNLAPFFIESGQKDVQAIMDQIPAPDSDLSNSAT